MKSRQLLWSLPYLLLLQYIRVSCQSYTYVDPESYAVYPQWLTTREGVAVFSFRASQADGLLFYVDSEGNGGNYLAVWLQDGQLKARTCVGDTAVKIETTFGQHLNDLQLHTLRIRHFDHEFHFYLDNELEPLGNLTYELHLTFRTYSSVFFGGIPTSHEADYEPAKTMKALAGCMANVSFSNNTISTLELELKIPTRTNELLQGCVDKCAGDDTLCNGGECVTSWSIPNGYFCDCSSAANVGEFCTSDSSNHQLTLDGESYYCYTLTHQPFTDHHNDILVELLSPLPSSGTILTGHSQNGTNQFHLYLRDNAIHYELMTDNGSYSASSTMALSREDSYQISVQQSHNAETIIIKVQRILDELTEVETILLQLLSGEMESVFSSICVGGVDWEENIYSGTMERLFVGHIALLEQRNSTFFTRKKVEKVDLVSVSDTSDDMALTFKKHGLQSDRISFEFRLWKGSGDSTNLVGVLLSVGNQSFQLTIILFDKEIIASVTNSLDITYCDNMVETTEQWHFFEMEKYNDGEQGILIRIDNDTEKECRVMSSELSQNFHTLTAETSTLKLGPTTTAFFGTPRSFSGCFQNIKFLTGTETFRPNLEVAIAQSERLSSDGCFLCTPEENVLDCHNNGICEDPGVFHNRSCRCPPQFTGPLCKDIDIPTASTPTPAETPSTTTPTDDTTTPITTPTSSETSVTTKPTDSSDESSGIDYNALGQWVGIATAILLVLILLVILLVFIGCVMHSQRLKRVGFYRTHENTANVTLPHFSASLKTAHSQTLDLEQNRVTAITNGRTVHPTHASGEKEFYI